MNGIGTFHYIADEHVMSKLVCDVRRPAVAITFRQLDVIYHHLCRHGIGHTLESKFDLRFVTRLQDILVDIVDGELVRVGDIETVAAGNQKTNCNSK